MTHRLLPLLALLALLVVARAGAGAMTAESVAQQMTALSLGHQPAAGDLAVAKAQLMLERVSQGSGEDATAVFAACRRYAGHLRDAAQISASQLELLAALDAYGRPGRSLNETLQAYVAARKAAPDRSHATAMAALARQD